MARACTICTHPERDAIDRALVAGEPVTAVAARYFTVAARMAVQRHRDKHIPAALAGVQQAAEEARALDLVGELRAVLGRVNLLFDACDRWLRDPDDPSRYEVGPRADDVRVIYWAVGDDGKRTRKTERLSALLARIEGDGLEVERGEFKHTDPRDLLLKTADRLHASLELTAKLLGELDERPTVNLVVSPEWQQVRATLLDALRPYADARAAVAGRLRVIEGGRAAG